MGVGSFGRVELVCDKEDPSIMYALKMQQKHNIMTKKQLENCLNERKLLELCGAHPFICTLHATYQDKDLLYMLLECVKGGELFQLLKTSSHSMDLSSCHFYTACVVNALGYLHSNRIIYRDLKPENLLIDADGYLKIVDFGFAKKLKKRAFRTYTICGTPDYMAPEMLMNMGYDVSVDVWAVGVLIFEMICGYAPFSSDSNGIKVDAAATMKNIMNQTVLIPQWLWDSNDGEETIRMIRSLLIKAPINRLGCGSQGGILTLFRHSWFENIDQNEIYQRRVKAPWRPELGEDGSNVVEPTASYQWEFNVHPYDGSQEDFKDW